MQVSAFKTVDNRIRLDHVCDDKGVIITKLYPQIALKRIRRGVLNARIPGLYISDTYNKYKMDDFDTACENIKTFLLNHEFFFNESAYEDSMEKYHQNPNDKNKTLIFKSLMSRKYKAFLVEDSPMDCCFANIDCFDLINPETKTLYKCKYSSSKISMSRDFEFARKLVPDGYSFILLVNNGAQMSKNMRLTVVHEDVEFEDYEEVPKKEIDDAVFEIEYIAQRLISDDELEMRVEQFKAHEFEPTDEDKLGQNHIAEFHILTNKTRDIIDIYADTKYFKVAVSTSPNAKKLYDLMYSE